MFAAIVLLLASSTAAAESPGPAPTAAIADPVLYTARAGDNLYMLARQYFIHVEDYVRVQHLNRVRDPRKLPVGRVLRIPRELLRYVPLTATVAACRGRVDIRGGGGLRTAAEGSVVREGEVIVTTGNSFVSLRLPDGSIISLPSRSEIGVRRLRRILLTGGIERLFALDSGRARAIVTPAQNGDDSFRVSTPVAVSAVRGTEFRARYDVGSGRGATEVLKGRVAVAAADSGVLVGAGFATVATTKGTGGIVALLPPPALRDPARIQDEPELDFEIAPLAAASAYHVQIASDAGFVDVIEETTARDQHVALPAIQDGTWFVRVSAVDADGVEGEPETYAFQRRLQRIRTSLEQRKAGRYREYLFRWTVESAGTRQYRFQLIKDRPDATSTVDRAGLTADRFVITDLPPGTYYWRVMSLQFADGGAFPKWSAFERLVIAPDR